MTRLVPILRRPLLRTKEYKRFWAITTGQTYQIAHQAIHSKAEFHGSVMETIVINLVITPTSPLVPVLSRV